MPNFLSGAWAPDPTRDLENIARNRKIFGGDLIGASHLWGNWYSYGFT